MATARRVLVALLLGAATSVAVAWVLLSLARTARQGSTMHAGPDDAVWWTPQHLGPGWHRITMWPAEGVTEYGRSLAEPMPWWCVPLPPHAPPDSILEMVGAGWPLVCVRGHRTGRDDSAADIARTGTIRTGIGPQAIAWNERVGTLAFAEPAPPSARGLLPWHPVWLGLAADTALFALPWLLVVHLGAIRRLARRRRGRCPQCAYPLRESGICPECGREV